MSPDLQAEMLSAANSAVEHAMKLWSTELDYSARSVEDVELILARMYESIPHRAVERLFRKKPTEEQMATASLSYGAYLGEVIRREFGGAWETREIGGQPAIALVLDPNTAVFPPAKVWKRLSNGADENVWTFYVEFTGRLRDQRARLPKQESLG